MFYILYFFLVFLFVFKLYFCNLFRKNTFTFLYWCTLHQGGITCGATDEPRKSSKAINERVVINFRDKNAVIARFRDKNVVIARFRDK